MNSLLRIKFPKRVAGSLRFSTFSPRFLAAEDSTYPLAEYCRGEIKAQEAFKHIASGQATIVPFKCTGPEVWLYGGRRSNWELNDAAKQVMGREEWKDKSYGERLLRTWLILGEWNVYEWQGIRAAMSLVMIPVKYEHLYYTPMVDEGVEQPALDGLQYMSETIQARLQSEESWTLEDHEALQEEVKNMERTIHDVVG